MKRQHGFARANRGALLRFPPGKTRITIRLDKDVLDWFRRQVEEAGGGNYQTVINSSLRDYVLQGARPSRTGVPLPDPTSGGVLRDGPDEPPGRGGRGDYRAGWGAAALFGFQDYAETYNFQFSPAVQKRFDHVDHCVRVGGLILQSLDFPSEKQRVLRGLGVDALTSVAVALRVGLWGNIPEAYAVLRAGLETSTVLKAVVHTGEYRAAANELSGRLRRFTFEASLQTLPSELARNIRRLHVVLSELGSRAFSSRVRPADYSHAGEPWDRLAAALSPEDAEAALTYCPLVALHVLTSLADAYRQDGQEPPGAAEISRLEEQLSEPRS